MLPCILLLYCLELKVTESRTDGIRSGVIAFIMYVLPSCLQAAVSGSKVASLSIAVGASPSQR